MLVEADVVRWDAIESNRKQKQATGWRAILPKRKGGQRVLMIRTSHSEARKASQEMIDPVSSCFSNRNNSPRPITITQQCNFLFWSF